MRVVGINDNYTMSVPLEILGLIAGDFDGDTLSILSIINKSIEAAAEEVFSPRYAMYISRNDGMFNDDINHQKDIIIAACALIDTARKYYTEEELEIIYKAQHMDDIIPVGDMSKDKVDNDMPSSLNIASASVFKVSKDEPEIVQSFMSFLQDCKHYSDMYNLAFSGGGNSIWNLKDTKLEWNWV